MRARLVIPAAVIPWLVVVASSASAATRPASGTRGSGAFVNNGNPTATAVEVSGSPSRQGSGANDGRSCEWHVHIEDDKQMVVYTDDSLEPQHSPTGRWFQYVCDGEGPVAVNGRFLIPEGEAVDPAALAAEAVASIDIAPPAIGTSPSADERLYVRIPTWLWLDQSWWRTYEATASAGSVTATVTARPVSISWMLGDGESLTCAGPGRAWQRGLPETASDCRYVYRSSSAGQPGGTFNIQATVMFEVSWSSNIGAGGALPSISRSSTVDVEVGEIQAIGTG
jgi:hypothetical protein